MEAESIDFATATAADVGGSAPGTKSGISSL